MMPSRVMECQNRTGSSSFDPNAYTNMMMHPRVQALMFAHIPQESKAELTNLKFNKPGLHSYRREESEGGDSKRKRATSAKSQIEQNWEESKEVIDGRNSRNISNISVRQQNSLRSDRYLSQKRINTCNRKRELHQERIECPNNANRRRVPRRSLSTDSDLEYNLHRINLSVRGSELHQERQGSLNDTSEAMFSRTEMRYRSLSPDYHHNFVMDKVLKSRQRLYQYEARRLRRQAQRLSSEFGSEFSDVPLLKNEKNGHSDDRGTTATKSSNSQEDVEMLCKRVRDNLAMIRYRIHSSRALLAREPISDWEEFQQPDTHNNGRAQDSFDIPSISVPKAIDISEGSLKIKKSWLIDNDLNDAMDRRTKGQSIQSKEEMRLRVTTVSKHNANSTAFDPFPSTIIKSVSRDDAAWRDSDFFAQPLDLEKAIDFSKDALSHTGRTADSSSGSETVSSIEKVQTKNDPSGPSLISKDKSNRNVLKALSEIHKPLICSTNRKFLSDDFSGEKSQSTADISSIATSPSQQSFKKKDKERKIVFSPFSNAKVPNKEWLRTSVGLESNLTRKRDREMLKWLTAGSIPGLDLAHESVRQGSMEMVFYDTKRKHLEEQ